MASGETCNEGASREGGFMGNTENFSKIL